MGENMTDALIKRCEEIETEMGRDIDYTNFTLLEDKLSKLLNLLSKTPGLMQDAVFMYATCKKSAVDELMRNSLIVDAKQSVQLRWLEGHLAKADSIYTRVERCCKDLVNCTEGYRSILSFEKEQMRNNAFAGQRQT